MEQILKDFKNFPSGNFDRYILSNKTLEACKNQDILIMPKYQEGNLTVFTQESINFYKYSIRNRPEVKINFFAEKERISEESLNCGDIFLPIIFVTSEVIFSVALGLITNYIYDRIKGNERNCGNIKFSIVSNGKDEKKQIEYDGNLEGFEKLLEKFNDTNL